MAMLDDLATTAWPRLSALGRFIDVATDRTDAPPGWRVVLKRGGQSVEGEGESLVDAFTRALDRAEAHGWKG